MKNVIQFAQQAVASKLKSGAKVLDATAGNGKDTLYFAQKVGAGGRVYAFDIQTQALANCQALLQRHQLADRVKLIAACHANIDQHLATPIDGAIFNFGYLPGGDKQITTLANSSLLAIEQTLNLLKADAIAALVIYSKHAAGKIEQRAIEAYLAGLSQQRFNVLRYQFANRPPTAPYALICHKIAV